MDDDGSSDLQKCLSENQMDRDEVPLINENSNGLSHLLTDGEFSNVDAAVDESSISNQGFLNAVELSAGSVGDYLENNADAYNTDSFDVGDMAVNFPTDSLDGDSRLSAGFKLNEDTENDSKIQNDSEMSNGDYALHENMESSDALANNEESNSSDKNNIDSNKNVDSNDIQGDKMEEIDDVGNSAFETNDIADNVTETNKTSKEVGCAGETEVVSEDELPAVEKPSVKDAENVSDDELPGPKPADLPADTEVVSEDELPSSKKESSRKRKPDEECDYDPESPTSEKKQAIAKNGESKPIPAEKRSSTDEKPKKKPLPELERYWKVVNDDPTDFTGWTYLLQYVDQESDVEAAREAYDAFLSHYPYCYGYWRKYADYEKRKGSKKKCLECDEANNARKPKSSMAIGEFKRYLDIVIVLNLLWCLYNTSSVYTFYLSFHGVIEWDRRGARQVLNSFRHRLALAVETTPTRRRPAATGVDTANISMLDGSEMFP
ncbi:unnamed protein product [Leptosia nina]|uniref:Pre-mRNA-processing factor 39 n=1 Tax=Leptosia nina TaxID=320188 RepID=A0AAV1JM93_9NEOP